MKQLWRSIDRIIDNKNVLGIYNEILLRDKEELKYKSWLLEEMNGNILCMWIMFLPEAKGYWTIDCSLNYGLCCYELLVRKNLEAPKSV